MSQNICHCQSIFYFSRDALWFFQLYWACIAQTYSVHYTYFDDAGSTHTLFISTEVAVGITHRNFQNSVWIFSWRFLIYLLKFFLFSSIPQVIQCSTGWGNSHDSSPPTPLKQYRASPHILVPPTARIIDVLYQACHHGALTKCHRLDHSCANI